MCVVRERGVIIKQNCCESVSKAYTAMRARAWLWRGVLIYRCEIPEYR